MLEIQNHQLLLNGKVISDLPHLPYTTTITVWRVPESYRASGYFVGTQKAGDPEELPACDLSQCEKLTTLLLKPHPDAVLEAAKKNKKEKINQEREEKQQQNVIAHGRPWQADKRSQELLLGAIATASAGGALPSVWRDANNQDMQITSVAQLVAIMDAIRAQVEQTYIESWMKKAAVDAATTLDEVDMV